MLGWGSSSTKLHTDRDQTARPAVNSTPDKNPQDGRRLLLSIICVLLLALAQLLYARHRRRVTDAGRLARPPTPTIHTYSSEDQKKSRSRFKRDDADISDWIQAGQESSGVDSIDVARVRQQMIDRVLEAGTVDEENLQDASFKVDVIRSIRELDDDQVLAWWTENKDLLPVESFDSGVDDA